uniref:Transketolase n=1 Tax=uncultured bacterium contig00031 TaxID=1181520 RepID=A0A806KIU7_9BACT|nr:transketolase [uncultured bacterium contig00031]
MSEQTIETKPTREPKEMRAAYVDTIMALAEDNKNIVVLEADLMSCTNTGIFKKTYPDRFFNVGIAEANMVGIASGLSVTGKIPFAASFGCFASRRVYDQFFLSANYARLNVKLVGTDPGVTAAFNGGTHMPFEDLAMMRVVPGLTVVEPSDPTSCAAFVRLMAEQYGCHYLRIPRKPVPFLYPDNEGFKFGQAKVLREGKDLCFVALGSLMVGQSLKASEALAALGISAGVLDLLTLKPIDSGAILEQAGKVRALISAENAQIAGGLGGAVAEILAENGCRCKFARIGIHDEFGEVGTQDYLVNRFGLDVGSLVKKAQELLG